jgi:hypothetical protein
MDTHAHILALFLSCVLTSAMALTYKAQEEHFRIAAYLEVFHEGSGGWEFRTRGIGDFIRRRGAVQRRSLANVLEPRLLAWLYLPLVLTSSLLLLASPITTVRTWNVAPAALALGAGTYLFLELGFYLERTRDFWLWWWTEYRRLEAVEPYPEAERPHTQPNRHDPATTMMALLLLQLALLFLFGVVTEPPISGVPH